MLYNHAKFCIAGVEMPVSDVIQVSGGLLTTKLSFVLTDKEAYLASPMARSRYEDVPIRLYISKPFNAIPDTIKDSDYITVFDGSASLTLAYNPVTRQLDIGVTARPGSVAAFSSVLYSELSVGLLTTANTAGDVAVIDPEFVNEGISATVTGTGLNNMNSILFLKRLVDGKKAQDISRPTDILDFAVHNLLTYAEAKTGSERELVPWTSDSFLRTPGGSFVEQAVKQVVNGDISPNLFLEDIILRSDLAVELKKVSESMATNYWSKLLNQAKDLVKEIESYVDSVVSWKDRVASYFDFRLPFGLSENFYKNQGMEYDPRSMSEKLDDKERKAAETQDKIFKSLYSVATLLNIPLDDSKSNLGRLAVLTDTKTELWFPSEVFSKLWTTSLLDSEESSKQRVKTSSLLPKILLDAVEEADRNWFNSNLDADAEPILNFGETFSNDPELLVILNSYMRSYLYAFGMYCVRIGDSYRNVLDFLINAKEDERASDLYRIFADALQSYVDELLKIAISNIISSASELTSKFTQISYETFNLNLGGVTANNDYRYQQQLRCAYPGNGSYSWGDVSQTGRFIWTRPLQDARLGQIRQHSDCVSTWLNLAQASIRSGLSLGLKAVKLLANTGYDLVPFYVLPNNPAVSLKDFPLKKIQDSVAAIYKALNEQDVLNEDSNVFKNANPMLFDLRAASKMVDWAVYNRMGTLGFMRLAQTDKSISADMSSIFPNLKLVELQELQQLVAGQATSTGNGGTISLMELLQRVTSVLHLGITTPLNKAYAVQRPQKPYAIGSTVPGLEYNRSVTELMLLPVNETWCVPRCNVFYSDRALPTLENYDRTKNTSKIIVKYDPPIVSLPGGSADHNAALAVPSRYFTFDITNPGKLIEWTGVVPDSNKVYSYDNSTGFSIDYKAGYLYDMYRTQMISVNRELALLSSLCSRVVNSDGSKADADATLTSVTAESDTLGFDYKTLGDMVDKICAVGDISKLKTDLVLLGPRDRREVFTKITEGYGGVGDYHTAEYALEQDKTNSIRLVYVKKGSPDKPKTDKTWLKVFTAACAQVALAFNSKYRYEIERVTESTNTLALYDFVERTLALPGTQTTLDIKFHAAVTAYIKGFNETRFDNAIGVAFEDNPPDLVFFFENKDGYHRFSEFVTELGKIDNTEAAVKLLSSPAWETYLASDRCFIQYGSLKVLKSEASAQNLPKLQNELSYKDGETISENLNEFIDAVTDDGELRLALDPYYGVLDNISEVFKITFGSIFKRLLFLQAYTLGYIDGIGKSLQSSPESLPNLLADSSFLANAISYQVETNTSDGFELKVTLTRRAYSGVLKVLYPDSSFGDTQDADNVLSSSAEGSDRSVRIKDYFKNLCDVRWWDSPYSDDRARGKFLGSVWRDLADGKPSDIVSSKAPLTCYLTKGTSYIRYSQPGSPNSLMLTCTQPYFYWTGDITSDMDSNSIPQPQHQIGFILKNTVPKNILGQNTIADTSLTNTVAMSTLDDKADPGYKVLLNIADVDLYPSNKDAELTSHIPTWPFVVWFNQGHSAAIVNMNLNTGSIVNLCSLTFIRSDLKLADREFYYFNLDSDDDPLEKYYIKGFYPKKLMEFINAYNPWTTQSWNLGSNMYVALPLDLDAKSGLAYYSEIMGYLTAQVLRYLEQAFSTYDTSKSYLDPRREVSGFMLKAITDYQKGKPVKIVSIDEVPNSKQQTSNESAEETSRGAGVNAELSGTANANNKDVSLSALFSDYNPARTGVDLCVTYGETTVSWRDSKKGNYQFLRGKLGPGYVNDIAALREVGRNSFMVHGGFDVFMNYYPVHITKKQGKTIDESKRYYEPYNPAHRKVAILAPFDCVIAYGMEGSDSQFTGFGLYAMILPLVDDYMNWKAETLPGLLIAHLDPILTFDRIKNMNGENTFSELKGRTLEDVRNTSELAYLASMADSGITTTTTYYFTSLTDSVLHRNLTVDEQAKLKKYIHNLKTLSIGAFFRVMVRAKKGTPIAYVGCSGGSEGWHAHINCRQIPITDTVRSAMAAFYTNANPAPMYKELFVKGDERTFTAYAEPVTLENKTVVNQVPWGKMQSARDKILKKLLKDGFGNFDQMLPDIMAKVQQAQNGMKIVFNSPVVPMSSGGQTTFSTVAETTADLPPELITSVAATAAYQESMRRLCTIQPDPIRLPYYDPYIMDGTMPGAIVYRNDLVLTKVISYAVSVAPNGLSQSLVSFGPGLSVRRMLPMYLKTMYELRSKPYTEDTQSTLDKMYQSWAALSVYPFHSLNFYNQYAYNRSAAEEQYKDLFGKDSFVFDWREVTEIMLDNIWYTIKTIVDGATTNTGVDLLRRASEISYSDPSSNIRFNLRNVYSNVSTEPKNEASLLLGYRAWDPDRLCTKQLAESQTFDPKRNKKVASEYAKGESYEILSMRIMDTSLSSRETAITMPKTFYDWAALFKRLRKTVITPKSRFE